MTTDDDDFADDIVVVILQTGFGKGSVWYRALWQTKSISVDLITVRILRFLPEFLTAFPLPDTSSGLFARWIRDIKPKDFWNFPSGVSKLREPVWSQLTGSPHPSWSSSYIAHRSPPLPCLLPSPPNQGNGGGKCRMAPRELLPTRLKAFLASVERVMLFLFCFFAVCVSVCAPKKSGSQ